ncbi:MAG: HNH endonuclease [Lachnospiraceae bacterium]|nr:HNH endonuclease [Lachnospiraceae bacterium]
MGFAYGHQYTAEEVDFILDNYQHQEINHLHIMFNELYPPGVTLKSLKSKIRALGATKRNLQDNYGEYTQEMIDWLCEAYRKRDFTNFDELTSQFNNRFNTSFTRSAIWHKTNRALDNQIIRTVERVKPRVVWTAAMIEYLKLHLNESSYNTLAKQMSDEFKCYITASSLEHKVSRLGLEKDLSVVYKYRGHNAGCFKKGRPSVKRAPIGYERTDWQGNIWIKYADPDKFMRKARFIYIQHYGDIPKSHNVVCINGDPNDLRIENLIALSNSELAYFNNLKIDPQGNNDIATIKLDLARLMKKIGEKENGSKK